MTPPPWSSLPALARSFTDRSRSLNAAFSTSARLRVPAAPSGFTTDRTFGFEGDAGSAVTSHAGPFEGGDGAKVQPGGGLPTGSPSNDQRIVSTPAFLSRSAAPLSCSA